MFPTVYEASYLTLVRARRKTFQGHQSVRRVWSTDRDPRSPPGNPGACDEATARRALFPPTLTRYSIGMVSLRVGESSQLFLFPEHRLRFLGAICSIGAVAVVGCTDPLRVGPLRAGGATGTGGITNPGGGIGAGGSGGQGGTGGSATIPCGTCWAEWPMPNGPADVAAGAPNPESYTDNGDGTVTDNVTGLMWQQTAPSAWFTWTDAVDYCLALTLDGYRDWRLPSRIELVSIVDASVSEPSINSTAFPGTPSAYTWSSTPLTRWPSCAWSVNFAYGYAETANSYYGNTDSYVAAAANAVRCVRPAAVKVSGGRYTMTQGTVYDTKTKLTWQQPVPTTTYAWAAAKTYCASTAVSSSLGGSGWRLPTYKELLTIVDNLQSSGPMIDRNAFPGTPSSDFWSSTTQAGLPSSVWRVDFDYGSTDLGDVPDTGYVRCVR
jgi:hypothetical protein